MAIAASPTKMIPFDFSSLIKEWGDEPEFLAKILEIFVRDTRADLETLALALSAEDQAKLARTAHHLKGAAGILGAEAIRKQAALLEELGFKGELADAEACMAKLRSEYSRFIDSLSELALPPGPSESAF